jgi:endonuclease/exonuclease/phosphatase family metal-dependent hydrolase
VTVKVLSYNIKHGGTGREQQLLAVIRRVDPDIVVFQEAKNPECIERLAEGAGMAQWAAMPRTSLGFMCRTRAAHYEWYRPRVSRHAFLEIVPSGTDFRVFGVHLSAVHAAWTEARRVFELRALLGSIKKHQHGMHVLVGDFNTLAPGELLDIRKLPHRLRALVWLSGRKIRWRTIQVVLDAGYEDGYRARHPEVPGYTFPTWNPHVRLDYAFVPSPFAGRLVSCEIVNGPETLAASDHFPLLAEISTTQNYELRTKNSEGTIHPAGT